MPWIRLDDHFDEHPKVARVGPLGGWLFICGLAYCNRNLTDGFVPWSVAESLVSWRWRDDVGTAAVYVGTPDEVSEEGRLIPAYPIQLLIDAGLWEESPGGYRIHDYAEYQPTKAAVMAERIKKATAGRAGGQASAQARAKRPRKRPVKQVLEQPLNGSSTVSVAETNPVPVPKPVPNTVTKEAEQDVAVSVARAESAPRLAVVDER